VHKGQVSADFVLVSTKRAIEGVGERRSASSAAVKWLIIE
jgi:hypothetical protein